ncbi:fimbrial assembly family protein [Desulforamulus ruminis DSM 2154]|uniref:Fimbrial assembly family protein n=1 Tax=Desulforamulus ruminis (strain ATCC 23193 / DSM 2154 / NCIMB 8452 / DL) TaxID=696281 RepID=F6DRJ4_DESRL|nr:fimbrial assembly family protein [Desulforamulus ruminis DSM 2154]
MVLAVLVIEIDGMTLRAAVVRRKFRDFTVSQCMKLERTGDSPLITPGELTAVLGRLEKFPKNVVLVSDQTAMVEITMDPKRLKKMKSYQIKEAVRWEAEPYMAVPAAESLVGYERGPETPDGQASLWVSMFPLEDYQMMKKNLAEGGLKLKRIFPPDVCFPIGAVFSEKEKELVVLDVGQQTMRFALVEDRDISAFRTLPGNLAAAKAHLDGLPIPELEPTLKEILLDPSLENRKLVITGPGGLDSDIVNFFQQKLLVEAAGLQMQCSGHPATEFATVIGAGLRELYLLADWKTIGIHDGIPLAKQLQERLHVYPLLVAGTILVFFLGHYFLLNYQSNKAEARLASLQQELNEAKTRTERYQNLKKEETNQEKETLLLHNKLDFLHTGFRERHEEMETFLKAVLNHSPGDLDIIMIAPGTIKGQWLVGGLGTYATSVHFLSTQLQNEEWCSYVNIIGIGEEETKIEVPVYEGEKFVTKEIEGKAYLFGMEVRMKK